MSETVETRFAYRRDTGLTLSPFQWQEREERAKQRFLHTQGQVSELDGVKVIMQWRNPDRPTEQARRWKSTEDDRQSTIAVFTSMGGAVRAMYGTDAEEEEEFDEEEEIIEEEEDEDDELIPATPAPAGAPRQRARRSAPAPAKARKSRPAKKKKAKAKAKPAKATGDRSGAMKRYWAAIHSIQKQHPRYSLSRARQEYAKKGKKK